MPQADFTNLNRQQLKRFSLEIVNKETKEVSTYRFRVNPEEYSKELPQRTTVIKTQSNILVEDYGRDIPVITFSGQTGVRNRVDYDGVVKNGKQKLDELRLLVGNYARTGGSGNRSKYDMYFYNLTDEESMQVHLAPQGIKITRSKDEALIYRYEITLLVLGTADQPSDNEISSSNIGNNNKSSDYTSDRYRKSQTQQQIEARERNNQALDNESNASKQNLSGQSVNAVGGYNSLGNDNKGNTVYNPRNTTNGQDSSVNNMALAIDYGVGGF